MIKEKVGPTLLLGITAAIIALLLGTALGIYGARHEGSILDTVISTISYGLDAMPSFWLGLMLIIVFANNLGLLPTSGMTDQRMDYTGFAHYLDVIKHMVLPTVTLAAITMPG